jgi:hypothetical protein
MGKRRKLALYHRPQSAPLATTCLFSNATIHSICSDFQKVL